MRRRSSGGWPMPGLELESAERYEVRVVNDELDQAVEELASILIRNGCGTRRDHD